MRNPLDIYIFIAIAIKIAVGAFLPISGLRTMLINVGSGMGSLFLANLLRQFGDDCTKVPTSFFGRFIKSIFDSGPLYFGGSLFTFLVALIPIFKVPVKVLSMLPGSSLILENLIWVIGVMITALIIWLGDSAKSKKNICVGDIGFGRIIVSLIVFGMAMVYEYILM